MLTPLAIAALAAAAPAVQAGPILARDTAAAVQNYTSADGARWYNAGCNSDLMYGSRALGNRLAQAQQTVDGCLDACDASGYQLCGVEWTGECWGDNTIADWSTSQGASACTLPCAGNSTQLCGGTGGVSGSTFQLYKRYHNPSPSSTESANTTTTTTTAAETTPTKDLSGNVGTKYGQTLNGWTYTKCGGAYLNQMWWTATLDECLAHCDASNATICGVGYGTNRCFIPLSYSTPELVMNFLPDQGEGACGLPCPGNNKQACGSDDNIALWTKPEPVTTTTTTTTTTAAPTPTPTGPAVVQTYNTTDYTWTRQGCYSDLMYGSRALSTFLPQAPQTVDGCLDYCESKGFKQCGVEWTGECWGGNSLADWSSEQGDDACALTCAGNSKQICGGTGGVSGSAFQYYKRSSRVVSKRSTLPSVDKHIVLLDA
ncbi:hypothetical protein JCM6882_006969 [Rhodosporidiobolus microsporus]